METYLGKCYNFLNLIGLELGKFVGAREKGLIPGSKSRGNFLGNSVVFQAVLWWFQSHRDFWLEFSIFFLPDGCNLAAASYEIKDPWAPESMSTETGTPFSYASMIRSDFHSVKVKVVRSIWGAPGYCRGNGSSGGRPEWNMDEWALSDLICLICRSETRA
jgi:hypothetical protein